MNFLRIDELGLSVIVDHSPKEKLAEASPDLAKLRKMAWIWLGLAGAGGVLLRAFLDSWVPRGDFPWSTFGINLLGSFAIGFLFESFHGRWAITPDLKWIVLSGFLGGFTTFSAFSLQVLELWNSNHRSLALGYVFLCPALGVGAAALGLWIGRSI